MDAPLSSNMCGQQSSSRFVDVPFYIQDFVNIRHGMRNCIMLQSPNVVKTPEDEELIRKKQEYRARQKASVNK